MRWDVTAVAAGAGWVTSALLVGAEYGGILTNPRGEAIRHLALAVAAAATVVHKIEQRRHLDDLIFQMGRNVEAMEHGREGGNVYPLRATAATV